MINGISDIVDSVRRIIERWVNTYSLLQSNAEIGDTILHIQATTRFVYGDEILLTNEELYETGLNVLEVIDDTHLRLSSPVKFRWTTDDNSMARKCINGMLVQGVYYGDPDVIPQYPAITVVADNRNSKWLTLESTTEKYSLSINIYVQDATDEAGNRFLYKITDVIQEGLKRNIFPLVNDYNVTAITQSLSQGDDIITVADSSIIANPCARVFIEDAFKDEEATVSEIIDSTTVRLSRCLWFDYDVADNPLFISPTRLIYNSWPESIDYKKIHKGTLLKAATISWFAEEEEIRYLAKREPHLR